MSAAQKLPHRSHHDPSSGDRARPLRQYSAARPPRRCEGLDRRRSQDAGQRRFAGRAKCRRRAWRPCYFDIAQQDEWGKAFPLVQPDSLQHRRPQSLRLSEGARRGLRSTACRWTTTTFPREDDFIGGHLKTGQKWNGPLLREPSRFHNICEYLDTGAAAPHFSARFSLSASRARQSRRSGSRLRAGRHNRRDRRTVARRSRTSTPPPGSTARFKRCATTAPICLFSINPRGRR